MAGEAPEGSQSDALQYDSKTNGLFAAADDGFLFSYHELCQSFDDMPLQENLLRDIHGRSLKIISIEIEPPFSAAIEPPPAQSGTVRSWSMRLLSRETLQLIFEEEDPEPVKEERIPRRFKCELASKRSLLPTRFRKSGSRDGIKQPRKELPRKR